MSPMLIGEILAGLMFVGVIGTLLIGFPVAFSLAGTALIFGLVGSMLGIFDPSNLGSLAVRYLGTMSNEVLVAVPLFRNAKNAVAASLPVPFSSSTASCRIGV